jgi:phenylacetate-CoA ligase
MKVALSRRNIWEKTPRWIKRSLGRGLGVLPTAWLLGHSFRDNCRFIRDAEWWPADRAREYQLSRLRAMLTLAYERTAFYRRSFGAAGFHPEDLKSLDDMARVPTIDKHVVAESLADMCARSFDASDIDYVATGGTSGTPLQFYIDANRSSVEYAYLTVIWERVGYRLGMPMAVLRGKTVSRDRAGLYHEYDPILRHHYYSNFHANDANLAKYLEHIRRIGPCMFHAYPSSAHAMARHIIASGGAAPHNIKGVLLESENVYADQIEEIEAAFGTRTFASYGHSEKLVLAAQCEHSHNYHVWPTYGYFELLDVEGKPVTEPGREGEIVGTGFINTVVPFIRYRTGDWATYVGDRCTLCGREHTVIRDIQGRWPQGGLLAADGSVVSMTALNVHDDTFRQVREYQFHQSVPGRATLCVVPMHPLDDAEKQRIIGNMNRRLQGQVLLELEVRDELVKTSRGKQPRVIQECVVPYRSRENAIENHSDRPCSEP